MDLKKLVDSIKNFEGVTRKNPIKNITSTLNDIYNINGNTLLTFGDDASAISLENDENAILIAADGIWGKLMEKNPYWAGYCSVLVNVNDIAAMGAKPIAMVNVLSIKNSEVVEEVLDGIKDGCKKFKVPMIGGHVHPDTPYNALDVSIVGVAKKNHIIPSSGAETEDLVLVGIDLDGKPHHDFELNWDTTTHKSSELVVSQIKCMKYLAENKLVTAAKDISNPGIIGTLEMLLESSSCGAIVDLLKIPKAENVEWETWLKMYPGAGFVMTAKEENAQKCIEILEKYSIKTAVVGEVTEEQVLYLKYKDQIELVFNENNRIIKD